MSAKIDINREEIARFCKSHKIRRLALFGSVLRDDFRPDSDVDVLVEFEPDASIGFLGVSALEFELERILGRKIEIHTYYGLNPHFREKVLALAETQYERP